MVITADVLVTIRDLIFDNWTCSTPSSTAITATSFIVAPPKKKFTSGRTVSVSREVHAPKEQAMGPSPAVLDRDIIRICAWTQDHAELDYMLREIRRIIKANKDPSSGGLEQIDLIRGGKPRRDLRVGDNILGEDVRIRLWYQE